MTASLPSPFLFLLALLAAPLLHAQQPDALPQPQSQPPLPMVPAQPPQYDRVPWRTPRVSFQPQQAAVRDLLKEFAISQNLPLAISDDVKGVSSGSFKDIETETFLNTICTANDLVWFYDGVRMNIESTDEVVSRPLTLPNLTVEALNDVIVSIGYASGPPGREVQVKQGHRNGVLLLIGGPHFIQATDALARDIDAQEGKRQNEQITVHTYRLNYASASDLTLNNGSTSKIIPGVVRSLQNLMANQQPGSELSTGTEETNLRRNHQGLLGQGLAAIGNNNVVQDRSYNPYNTNPNQQPQQQVQPQPRRGRENPDNERPQSVDANDPRAPMIVADVRLNAVLVRDVASRMPLYEELIKMLDVPTRAIEISAAIVDIDSNNARNLGIEILSAGKTGGSASGRFGFNADQGLFDGNNTQGQTPSFVDSANLARGIGLNATSLISGGGLSILSRLRALEQQGAGQVLSSPTVFTMENVEAVIRTQDKVYVRVQGNMATDLFDVSTGVQLRVTPSIVTDGGRSAFKLVIDITDGSFSDTKVDSIPSTSESGITTQAMVPDSKTLLLGGYTVERRTSTDSGVPILNKIPVLGKLLSKTERNHERSQRFFFITPRLVDLNGETTNPAHYLDGRNPLEIPPQLPDPDLSRETPEDMARRMAASTVHTGREPMVGADPGRPGVLPAIDIRAQTPGDKQPVPQPVPAQPANREPLFNRLFKH